MMDADQVRLKYVRITNGLSVPFTDRYDGVPVTIPAGKSENVPIDMAKHFFGPDFTDAESLFRHISRRQGWNTVEFTKEDPESGKTRARANFDALKIEPITYKLTPVEEPDPHKPVPALQEVSDDQPRRPGRPRRNPILEAADESDARRSG